MRFTDLLGDTLSTLWAHKLRTFLTMFGIAWGIISITLMTGAGEGLRVGQQQQQETMGKDIMIVWGGRTSLQAGGMRAGRRIRWQDTDIAAITPELTACRYVLPELSQGRVPVRSVYNSATQQVTGSYPPFAEVRSLTVGQGRFYNEEDLREGRRVVFLGSDLKQQLFSSRNPLGETVTLGGYPYLVIGVMKAKDQNSSYDGQDINKAFIPYTAMSRDFAAKPPALKGELNQLLVTPKSVEQHVECKTQLTRALGRVHGFEPQDKEACDMWDTLEEARNFQQMTDGMKYFLGAVGITTLFLGGLSVMNVMLVAVRERTREIGVRKAVGATSRAILGQFFIETLIVVLLSGGVGLAIAYGLCWLVNLAPKPPFFAGLMPTMEVSILSFVLLGVTALAAAVYPASRAAAIDPIEALRFEAGG